jgi:16S rRNA (cytosine1402-N4)-methyltransferase
VLVPAVLAALGAEEDTTREGWIIDATVGGGGHSRAILETFPRARVFGVDQDPQVLELAGAELDEFRERVKLVHGRFSDLPLLVREAGVAAPIGVLFDLGANSLHFDRAERGFSFQVDGPLDMRMDPARSRTAADIVNHWDEDDLADLFYYEGGEHASRRIARAIVEARHRVSFQRTLALAELIASATGRRGGRTHPATRCFQALRRAVNEEGDELIAGLEVAADLMGDGGRLTVISFHSGEDRIVKRFLSERAREGAWRLVSKKPQGPTSAERRANPRARSARLRAAEKESGSSGAQDHGRDERGESRLSERW